MASSLPNTSRFSPGSSGPPGLDPAHTSLYPGQEAEAPAGDAGMEAPVQREQSLGASLGPEPLQLLPALLPQQDL